MKTKVQQKPGNACRILGDPNQLSKSEGQKWRQNGCDCVAALHGMLCFCTLLTRQLAEDHLIFPVKEAASHKLSLLELESVLEPRCIHNEQKVILQSGLTKDLC